MKKLIKILFSILLVSALSLSVIACNKEGNKTTTTSSDPMNFTFKLVEDDDGNQTYTLSEFSLSAKAKEFVDKEDWQGLADLVNGTLAEGATKYTAETIRVLSIPAVHGEGNIPVTKIGAGAISNQSFITELVVPDSIEEIEMGAFAGLPSLEKITVPFVGGKKGAANGGKLFGYIFGSAAGTGLVSITQNYNEGTSENTATYYIPENLTTVVVTGEVKVETKSVKYDIVDGEMIVNENGAFSIDTISYENSAVQPYAFYGVTTINSVEFKNATAIPDYTFYGCTGFKTLTVGANITTIGKYAYANCTSIRILNLANVTTIGEGAFNGCTTIGKNSQTAVNNVNFAKVTTIGKDAFVGCTNLNKDKVLNLNVSDDAKNDAFGKEFFAEDEE